MEKNKTTKKATRVQNKNLMPPMKKGETRNPNGRKKGQRNFATIYREAILQIGKTKNMTPEQIEEIMLKSGLNKAMKGDYKFYQDTFDRLHGKPAQSIAHSGDINAKVEVIYTLVPPINASSSQVLTEGTPEGDSQES